MERLLWRAIPPVERRVAGDHLDLFPMLTKSLTDNIHFCPIHTQNRMGNPYPTQTPRVWVWMWAAGTHWHSVLAAMRLRPVLGQRFSPAPCVRGLSFSWSSRPLASALSLSLVASGDNWATAAAAALHQVLRSCSGPSPETDTQQVCLPLLFP